MRYTLSQKKVQWLINNSNKITTDEAFERPYGCWSKEQTNSFLLSLLSGMVSAAFVFARTAECAEYCTSKEIEDPAGASYFYGAQANGHRWVSLDSKHRRETIVNFFNDKIKISGKYVDEQGQVQVLEGACFKDLNQAAKNLFLNMELTIIEYENATRTDLAKIFIAINSGAPLATQHFRNAMNTPLAGELRKVMRQFSTFADLYTGGAQAKMKQHEDFVKIFMHVQDEGQKISNTTLDDLFLKGEEVGLYGYFRSIYPLQDWNNTVHIVSELEKVADAKLSATSSKLASNSILLYAIALKRVLENSYVITDYAKFADALEKLDTRLQKKSMKEYGNDETSRHKTNFYFEWRRLNWGENRQYRAKSLWKAISKAPSTYGLELVQTVEIEEL